MTDVPYEEQDIDDPRTLRGWHERLRITLEYYAPKGVFAASRYHGWITEDEIGESLAIANDEFTALWQTWVLFMNLAEGFDF